MFRRNILQVLFGLTFHSLAATTATIEFHDSKIPRLAWRNLGTLIDQHLPRTTPDSDPTPKSRQVPGNLPHPCPHIAISHLSHISVYHFYPVSLFYISHIHISTTSYHFPWFSPDLPPPRCLPLPAFSVLAYSCRLRFTDIHPLPNMFSLPVSFRRLHHIVLFFIPSSFSLHLLSSWPCWLRSRLTHPSAVLSYLFPIH